MASDESAARVQVKVAGVVIGGATVYSDGRIVCNTRPTEFGKRIFELLQVGFAEGISIVPITIPATQVESST